MRHILIFSLAANADEDDSILYLDEIVQHQIPWNSLVIEDQSWKWGEIYPTYPVLLTLAVYTGPPRPSPPRNIPSRPSTVLSSPFLSSDPKSRPARPNFNPHFRKSRPAPPHFQLWRGVILSFLMNRKWQNFAHWSPIMQLLDVYVYLWLKNGRCSLSIASEIGLRIRILKFRGQTCNHFLLEVRYLSQYPVRPP